MFATGFRSDKSRARPKAAGQGYAAAQHYLGFIYDEGQGVAPDYAGAAKWYRKAADQKYAASNTNSL